jgi:hypothetical protein
MKIYQLLKESESILTQLLHGKTNEYIKNQIEGEYHDLEEIAGKIENLGPMYRVNIENNQAINLLEKLIEYFKMNLDWDLSVHIKKYPVYHLLNITVITYVSPEICMAVGSSYNEKRPEIERTADIIFIDKRLEELPKILKPAGDTLDFENAKTSFNKVLSEVYGKPLYD